VTYDTITIGTAAIDAFLQIRDVKTRTDKQTFTILTDPSQRPGSLESIFTSTNIKLYQHLDRLQDWYSGKDIHPLYLEIGPARTCNQRCIHCYIDHLGFEGVMLEEEIFLKLIDDIGKIGVKGIQFAGCGEPLMNQSLPKAIEMAYERKISVALTTNGILYKKSLIEKTLGAIT